MVLYYHEYLRFGRWHPATTTAEPTRQRADGSRGPEIRAVHEVDPCYRHLTLTQLAEIYGPDGRFQSVIRDARAA